MSYENILPEITDRILAVSDPAQIILFGSYARGDWGPDSDLDLLVVLDQVDSTRAASVSQRAALRGLLVPIDVMVATPEQLERHRHTIGLIYRTILTEGKVLYERPGVESLPLGAVVFHRRGAESAEFLP